MTVVQMTEAEGKFYVDERYKFLYCKIEKSACTSVISWMLDLVPDRPCRNVWFHCSENPGGIYACASKNLRRLSDLDESAAQHALDNYYSFTIVRNTWKRIVSAYRNKITGPNFLNLPKVEDLIQFVVEYFGEDEGVVRRKRVTFEQFLLFVAQCPDEDLDTHWQPQHVAMGDHSFSYICQHDNLKADFEKVRKDLGVSLQLPHLGPGSEWNYDTKIPAHSLYPYQLNLLIEELGGFPHPANFFTAELNEMVRNKYAPEISQFGFEAPELPNEGVLYHSIDHRDHFILQQLLAIGLWTIGNPLNINLSLTESLVPNCLNLQHTLPEREADNEDVDIYIDLAALNFPLESVELLVAAGVLGALKPEVRLALLGRWVLWVKKGGLLIFDGLQDIGPLMERMGFIEVTTLPDNLDLSAIEQSERVVCFSKAKFVQISKIKTVLEDFLTELCFDSMSFKEFLESRSHFRRLVKGVTPIDSSEISQ